MDEWVDYAVWDIAFDDVVGCSLVASLVLLLAVLAVNGGNIMLQVDSLTAPGGSRKVADSARMQDTALARVSAWATMLVVSAGLSALALHACGLRHDLTAAEAHAAFGKGVAFWMLFLAAKRWLAGVVHWTFFAPAAVRCWQCVHRLSVAVWAVLFEAVALVAVYNGLCLSTTASLCILAYISGLLVTICGTWRLFFGSFVGCLHFLLYLCTFELLLSALAVVVQAVAILPL